MPEPTLNKREHLSISTLMSFIRCPRRYFYSKCGLTSPDESNALSYGTAMHAAVPVALTQGLEPALETFKSLWNEDLADEKRSLRRAIAQLSHFHHTHCKGRSLYTFEKPPRGDLELTAEVSPLEVPAFIDVGLPVPLYVRIDGLVRHRDSGDMWGWEFKTASRIYGIAEAMELHPQILAYTLALRTVTGLRVRGMIAEIMLIDKTKVEGMTHPIPVQDHHVDDILLWLRYWGNLLLDCEARALDNPSHPERFFPKNFSGCSAYPHFYMSSFPCDYMNLCRPDDWRKMAPTYHVREDHKVVVLTKEGQSA